MGQIIWHFGVPTILACAYCDRIAHYHTETTCNQCHRPMIEFTCDPMDYHDALNEEKTVQHE